MKKDQKSLLNWVSNLGFFSPIIMSGSLAFSVCAFEKGIFSVEFIGGAMVFLSCFVFHYYYLPKATGRLMKLFYEKPKE